MELLKCLELYTTMRSYFTIFILHVHIFIKIIEDSCDLHQKPNLLTCHLHTFDENKVFREILGEHTYFRHKIRMLSLDFSKNFVFVKSMQMTCQ